MSVVTILILASLAVAAAFLGAFIWAVRNGQYEDTLTPSMRVLADDDCCKAGENAVPAPVLENISERQQHKRMNSETMKKLGVAAIAALPVATAFCAQTQISWLDNTISPVANQIYFEDPRITTEIRPVYMYHMLPETFHFKGGSVALGGQARVFAVQLRYAVNDKLAIIATKDGYIEFQPDHTLAHAYGFGDLAAGLKYALVDDRDSQLLVTPGLTVTLPTGNQNVFQARGSGEENVFVSAEKGVDKLHLTGNVGFRIPNNFDDQTAQLHYSAQADYYVCRWFIPFVVANGYTVLTDGNHKLLGIVPLNAEMYDLINFGATDAAGSTQFTLGGGARAKVVKNVDVGVAYEAGVADPKGIFDSRVTADVIVRF